MREILFRVKHDVSGEWLYGCPVIAEDKEAMYFFTDERNNNFKTHICMRKTLCQYTGLTDKNGTKIFDGDILKYTRTNWHEPYSSKNGQDIVLLCEVFYDEKRCAFCCNEYEEDTKKLIGAGLLRFDDKRAEKNIIEVIGNIHDNPELLRGGSNA